MKEIELYTTSNGQCPYIEWAKSLSAEYRVHINKRINRLRDGNFGDWKHLKNSKLSELRLHFGKGYRIYFKELDNVIVLILAGSSKSDQKSAIKQAGNYLEDYLERKQNNDNKI